MTRRDWRYSLVALVVIGLLIGGIMVTMQAFVADFNHTPSFMTLKPLSLGRYGLLLLWLPYWVLNIGGEEFFWRGVLLPRQEVVFGRNTWVLHGTGWAIFHIAFGWQLVVIWLITFPILISLLMEMMIGITDTAFLGRVGEVELGASAISGVFYLIIFMVASGSRYCWSSYWVVIGRAGFTCLLRIVYSQSDRLCQIWFRPHCEIQFCSTKANVRCIFLDNDTELFFCLNSFLIIV